MSLAFDIADDELQIFLAEADEHLQMLDEGLVRLERESDDPELLQAIFRAAHTLKGSAGVIGHKRMADLTHSLETVLDGLRKKTLNVSAALVDACLESLDALKLLRDEVVEKEANPVDIAFLVERLSSAAARQSSPASSLQSPAPASPPVLSLPVIASATKPAAVRRNGKKPGKPATKPKKNGRGKARRNGHKKRGIAKTRFVARRKSHVAQPETKPGISIQVDIAADSIASAARAFQVLMALQSLGEVQDLQPPQEVIETAMPVR